MYVHHELQEDKGSWEPVSAVGPSSEGVEMHSLLQVPDAWFIAE